MTLGRLLWLARRDLKRGWSASYHHYQTLPRIAHWNWSFWKEKPENVPLHVLTGENDWLLAAWMLASFFTFTETSWPLVIHDDGTLPEDGRGTLKEMFRNVRFISRFEADSAMTEVLQSLPRCLRYRMSHPLALKIFDMAHFANAERYLVMDSDVLFFRKPREIVDWARATERRDCWFNEDASESTLVSDAEAQEKLGIHLWPKVNSGLCLINREAIDFQLCEEALANTSLLRGHVWRIEQTLFALCASRKGRGGLLPKSYEVSLARRAGRDIVARHYVGAVRNRFFGEGLKRLAPVLFPKENE